MLENFIEYIWYLLTTPFKKVKKSLNKWYVFCRVFGKRFDDAKESLMRARDEGMVATCSEDMLQVHAADRKLTRYRDEDAENFRARIAMHEEVCRLGGLNEGIILAVRTLGYGDVEIQSYKRFKGNDDRWAEFFLIINMDMGENHPISFEILKKTVRQWKEVGAKDNYYMSYRTSVKVSEKNGYRIDYHKFIYFYDYLRTDGKWNLDGSEMLNAVVHKYPTRIGLRYRSKYTSHNTRMSDVWFRFIQRFREMSDSRTSFREKFIFYDYLRTDGKWHLDGSEMLNGVISPEAVRWSVRYRNQHKESLKRRMRFKIKKIVSNTESAKERASYLMQIDYFDYLKLNGLWYPTGSRALDAQRQVNRIRTAYRTCVFHTHRTDIRTSYSTVLRTRLPAATPREVYGLTTDYFDYIKLNGLWFLTGSRALDAQRSSNTMRIE